MFKIKDVSFFFRKLLIINNIFYKVDYLYDENKNNSNRLEK